MRPPLAPLFLLLTLGLAASGAGAEEAKSGQPDMGGMKMDAGPAEAAYDRAMQGMDQAMRQPMTGDADVDFVVMMLPHHQGAVDMARAALRYAKDPFVLQLAEDVVKSQEAEIAAMKQWLAARGKDAPSAQR